MRKTWSVEVDEAELREGVTLPGKLSSAGQAPETGGEVLLGEDRAVEATTDSVLHDLLRTPGEVSVEGLVGALDAALVPRGAGGGAMS